jgi:hypothetical protein
MVVPTVATAKVAPPAADAPSRDGMVPHNRFPFRHNGLYGRFLADSTLDIGAAPQPHDLAEAQKWSYYFTVNGDGKSVTFDESKLLGSIVFFAKRINDLIESEKQLVEQKGAASDATGKKALAGKRFLAAEERYSAQMRLNGLLHLLYDQDDLRKLLTTYLEDEKLRVRSSLPKIAVFSYLKRNEAMPPNDLVTMVLNATFGHPVRQREDVGSCFATANLIVLQENTPILFLKLVGATLGLSGAEGACMFQPADIERGDGSGNEWVPIGANCSENAGALTLGDWNDPNVTKSLQRAIVRTAADGSLPWAVQIGDLPRAFSGLSKILATSGHFNYRELSRISLSNSLYATTRKDVKARADSSKSEVDEGLGSFDLQIIVGSGTDPKPLTAATIGEALADFEAKLAKLETDPHNGDDIKKHIATIKRYADGEKQMTGSGGSAIAVSCAIYGHTLSQKTINDLTVLQLRSVAAAERFFQLIYDTLAKERNQKGHLAARFLISGEGHTYTIRACEIEDLIERNLSWSEALDVCIKEERCPVDPNWDHRSIRFFSTKAGEIIHVLSRLEEGGESGGPVLTSGPITVENGSFLFNEFKIYRQPESTPNFDGN